MADPHPIDGGAHIQALKRSTETEQERVIREQVQWLIDHGCYEVVGYDRDGDARVKVTGKGREYFDRINAAGDDQEAIDAVVAEFIEKESIAP